MLQRVFIKQQDQINIQPYGQFPHDINSDSAVSAFNIAQINPADSCRKSEFFL